MTSRSAPQLVGVSEQGSSAGTGAGCYRVDYGVDTMIDEQLREVRPRRVRIHGDQDVYFPGSVQQRHSIEHRFRG